MFKTALQLVFISSTLLSGIAGILLLLGYSFI